ncbi:MAG TPA: hypothetical protein VLF60_03325 [Candidatus Saccharimonadales bacterium]|nr:hypothetical protein [Candidatus Saccharimonadales bacterium]
MNLDGIWHSRYEYGRGTNDEPQTSEHRIKFTKDGDTWVGTSLPNDEGSQVMLTLIQKGEEFSGEWKEQTSPTGYYKGREFSGLILLLANPDGTELSGMCLGAGSSANRVKASKWTLRRENISGSSKENFTEVVKIMANTPPVSNEELKRRKS